MLKMRGSVFSAALLLAGFGLHAQDVPSGWKVVKDRQGACQLAVPADWSADKLMPSFVQSPDGKSNAVPHGLRAGQTFPDAMALAKQVTPPSKIIEESAKRVWYTYQGAGTPGGGTDWYVGVAGSTICTAQISFKSPVTEDTAKKIALSLTQAK
jgi:hypothetical protein